MGVKKKILLDYNYSLSNGQNLRKRKYNGKMFFRRLITGLPLLGLIPIIGIYPLKTYPFYFPLYLIFSIPHHITCVWGFWRGFFGVKSNRNKL